MHTTDSFIKLIKNGLIEEVNAALLEDPSLANIREPDGTSAVLIAAYYHLPAIARLLVKFGANLDVFEAAAVGEEELVRSLIKEQPELVNAIAPDGFQPLGLAAFFGHLEIALFLIESGAEVDSASHNPLKVMPLHSAVAGSWTELVRLLIAHGAPVNARQAEGFAPLHSAAQNGSIEIITDLLQAGADVNARDGEGKTPLMYALHENHEEAVELLTAHGAVV